MIVRKVVLTLGILSLFLVSPNLAHADFDKGFEASQRGDYETAIKEWMIDAGQGNADAQNSLGRMYALGKGVPVNDTEAVRWYRLAAEQGARDAQSNLGLMYATGEGVPTNYIFAYMWLNLAAAQGNELASRGIEILSNPALMTPDQIAEAQRLSAEWIKVWKIKN